MVDLVLWFYRVEIKEVYITTPFLFRIGNTCGSRIDMENNWVIKVLPIKWLILHHNIMSRVIYNPLVIDELIIYNTSNFSHIPLMYI